MPTQALVTMLLPKPTNQPSRWSLVVPVCRRYRCVPVPARAGRFRAAPHPATASGSEAVRSSTARGASSSSGGPPSAAAASRGRAAEIEAGHVAAGIDREALGHRGSPRRAFENTTVPWRSSTCASTCGSTRKPPLTNTAKPRAVASGGTELVPSASDRFSGRLAGNRSPGCSVGVVGIDRIQDAHRYQIARGHHRLAQPHRAGEGVALFDGRQRCRWSGRERRPAHPARSSRDGSHVQCGR